MKQFVSIFWFMVFILYVSREISSKKTSKKSRENQVECWKREYGEGKIVCVCNDTYCDTIPKPKKVEKYRYIIYTSNKAGLRFSKEIGKFKKSQSGKKLKNDIKVDSESKEQKIFGWGGAFTDSAGLNIKSLNKKAQTHLMKSYFSEEGLEYNLCRVPIAGTDFSSGYYTYDDTPKPDPELRQFKLAKEDYELKIPLIKQAMELRKTKPLKLFGSTWPAPKWMKTNNDFYGYGFIIKKYYRSWAKYFLRFLEEYKKNGIDFWGLTTQNEPLMALLGFKNLPTVGWGSADLAEWVRNDLGPVLKNSSFADTKIMILDDQKILLPWYTNAVLEDEETRKYVSGIAIHWYFAAVTPCNAMIKTQRNFPDIFILSTEACSGFQASSGVDLGSWERGEGYSIDIIEDTRCRVVGWVDWNMALNQQGGPTFIDNYVDSPIIVNAKDGEFYKQPMYYHIGHHSKFVPEGSVRIKTQEHFGKNTSIMVVAYQRPDKGIATVILNKKDEDVSVRIIDPFVGTANVVITKKSINTILYWYD